MELISRISKGSRMDQAYIPKHRSGFGIGTYVLIKPLETEKVIEKPYFYNIKRIEPLKLGLINEIISIIDKNCANYENIIFTGSFLEPGFNFNDIDILLICEREADAGHIKKSIVELIGIRAHLIILNTETLMRGLSTDPLYQMMLSRCVSKKRFIYKVKRDISYKILDLHLLKSKTLIDNFDILTGNEKYYLTRNMVAIFLFLQKRKIAAESVDREIKQLLKVNIADIKNNMLDKNQFLKKYKIIYNQTFHKIMECIKNGSKQK